jgi:NOL1/NOP2/fmu family ribosome biogenesis protein
MWVLDMCSAPGGKSGQAAARLRGEGFLLSNEFVPKRAKITVSNFERLGIRYAIVTSLDTKEFKKLFKEAFDVIIADVPCSGEGMLRKDCAEDLEWSEENVSLCAKRQLEILNNAPELLKCGGHIVYSTCTYSLPENEMVVDKFLEEHPDFELTEINESIKAATSKGIVYDGALSKELHLTRRFYPHVSPGEGQFIALLRKKGEASKKPTILYKDATTRLTREEAVATDKFFKENLISQPKGTLIKHGENIIINSHGVPIPPYSVFSAGVLLGKVEKGILFPAHQFFSAYGELFIRKEELSGSPERLSKYLHGEEIASSDENALGWCAVTYRGAALGGGKISSGKIKNHYPKGLRTKS